MLTREAAEALLKMIQTDAKDKVKAAGGHSWTKVGDSDDGVTLVVKVFCITKNQKTIDDFMSDT